MSSAAPTRKPTLPGKNLQCLPRFNSGFQIADTCHLAMYPARRFVPHNAPSPAMDSESQSISRFRRLAAIEVRGAQTTHRRHRDIKQDDVRFQIDRLSHRVRRFFHLATTTPIS